MKISVVTVCRNCENCIEKTMKSVSSQDFDNYEHLIIDGASTDRTLFLIEQNKTDKVRVISEPDKGLYDAMNKGIKFAKGDYIIFLNADDTFADNNVLSRAALKMTSGKDLYYGDLTFHNKLSNTFNTRLQDNVNYVYLCGGMLFHPSIFASKKLLENLGGFDPKYKIAADYDFILKALVKAKSSCEYLGFTVAIFEEGEGVSSNPENKLQNKSERKAVQLKYFSPVKAGLYNFWYKSLRSTLKLPIIKDFLRYEFLKNR